MSVAAIMSAANHALILCPWVQASGAQRAKAVAMVDGAAYSIWRLYLAGCAFYFI